MTTVTVHASKTYDVTIGAGLLSTAGEALNALIAPPARVMLMTDDTVEALYAARLTATLTDAGYTVSVFSFPHGEASKNTSTLVEMWEAMARAGLTRTDFVAALGGGVVGDMAGFAAATYLRGIPVVQFPTTLLSMVDSSVGGKTGVDLIAGKNLCGAFHQPTAVFCDTDTLATLPPAIFADGCAEVIKYGYIGDGELLSLLQTPFAQAPDEVVARCVAHKRDLVESDERDTGARQLLNLGHTVGHAIEKLSDYSVSHGSAVSIGMLYIARAAAAAGFCGPDVPVHIEKMLTSYALPTECTYSADDLARVAQSDKKRKRDSITLVLPERVGKSTLVDIPAEHLSAFFAGGEHIAEADE